MYEQGTQRLEEMLDLKKIVKNIRTIKTLLKHSILTKEVKETINQSENHIINISEEESEDDFETIVNNKQKDSGYMDEN